MKFVAIFITLILFGVMGYLMMDARNAAKGATNQLELLRRQQAAAQAQPAAEPLAPVTRPGRPVPTPEQLAAAAKESERLMQGAATSAPLMPPPTGIQSAPPAVGPGSFPGSAGAPGAPIAPLQPTPRQRQVIAAPPIARVEEVEVASGFLVIGAGSGRKIEKNMSFAVRRGDAIIARIKVTSVEDGSAIADIVPGSVPLGVDVKKGDDVIQDLPPL